jgi:hypothetical protein
VGTFYFVDDMAGFSMRATPTAGCDYLPLRRDRGPALHLAHV